MINNSSDIIMPTNDELNEDKLIKKREKHCFTTSNSTKLALYKRHRRSSISSIFELHMSQLDLNIFKINYDQKQKNQQEERRKSLGLLTSKNMINQIKNMNSLERNQNIESIIFFFFFHNIFKKTIYLIGFFLIFF